MRSRTQLFGLTIAATALLGTIACGHDEATTVEAGLKPLKAHVAAAELVNEGSDIEVRGIVHPARQAMVSSRVMGPVVALPVQAGDTVRKLQTLVEIEPAASEGQLAQARGALAQAQAALTLAERNLKRFEALHSDSAASDVELDMARMQFQQADGAVKQAEGAVKAASSVAEEAAVSAPFAARVVETLVEVGDMAAPGRPLVRIESLGGREIWLTVREADINRLSEGQKLPVLIDSQPDLGAIEGTVNEIMPSADPATHTFTVKMELGSRELRSGLSGRAILPGDMRQAVRIPASAVHQRGGLELVIVRADDGTARTRAVTTGAALGDGKVEILSGIKAGDEVVVDAPAPVADGTPVEVAS